MSSTSKLKETFEVESKYGAFFTGGIVYWSNNGEELLCQNTNTIKILDVSSGLVTQTFGDEEAEDEDPITTFTLSPDNEFLVISHKSGLIKQWSKSECRLMKLWRSIHKGPIAKLAINNDNQLASGGSDGSVRLWDLNYQACTHNLKGSQGVFSVLKYKNNKQIFGAADDVIIRVWDTESGNLICSLSGHYSKITDIAFHSDDCHMISSSRDKVIILWDLNEQKSKKVIPIYESIEGIVFLPNKFNILDSNTIDFENIHVACAGESGIIRIWDVISVKEVFSQKNSLVNKAAEEGGLAITQLLFNCIKNQFLIVSCDHNLIIHDLETFECIKQFVGFSDEILDVVLVGSEEKYLAVATNSADIKLYNMTTMSCQLLKGHTDLVLSLATSRANLNFLISSAKDNSIRLWHINENDIVNCIGVGTRHTDSVGSVALSNLTISFAVSVSQDNCLKLWQLNEKLLKGNTDTSLPCIYTELAHQKDINCVTVSPNDKLIATGSQDKTAKLWSADNLQQLAIFRGHRRGVWTVRFSPIDQVLMTTSADCTIKLWSITEMNCLKTIEGHDSSVLRGEFVSKGQQIVTSGSDGLIKLWNIKNSECVTTLDQHEGRVWALTISFDEKFIISGGSDSLLIKWKDVTIEKREEMLQNQKEIVLQEQELNNLLQSNELLKALKIALRLERPLQILRIIEKVIKTKETGLQETINQLNQNHKELLLKTAIAWNTNSKHCYVSQFVLNILMNELLAGDFRPSGLRSIIEDLLPYTERHFKRATKHLEELYLLNYTIHSMEPVTELPY